MTIEANLHSRIAELEENLRYIRDQCAYNLEEPGNENDTLEYCVQAVTALLHDNYVFDMEAFLDS